MAHLIDIDQKLFLLLNSLNNSYFDFIMFWISDKLIWIPMYLALTYILIKDYRIDFWKPVILVIIAVSLADSSSVHLFKNVFMRLRPCHEPMLEGMVHIVNGKCGGQYGFVSSHAANSFALGTTLLLLWKNNRRRLGIMIVIWAAIVSYSRIYLGVHYPADIVGGMMLGSLIASLVYYTSLRMGLIRQ